MSSPQQINVADLDLPQLADVRKQLEEELQHLTTSFQQLKQAQAKFKTCLENVAEVKPDNKDRTILVPLTNSLYVPGKLADAENVIVDVGTGYYVKKTRTEAQKHYTSKIAFVKGNLDALQETIAKKQENMGYLVNVMQAKMQAQAQGQGQAQQA
ncbi:Prefoldin-domain-containing protein [Rickenella mellea]|uniref:Prefoldin-domain-containing protein n=1 Tax=Rickenella mellea TaxID=50990 RepID=A0A4Y7QKD2_9AGAM|nr:Prefoldin-domain-containing protein [Rickenella mellea]